VPTTAWRFPGTEGADNAVARLKQLDSQDLINLMDIAVLRWPEYAAQPTTQEHVHEQGSKVASMVRRLQHPVIDGSMIESVKGDLRPGTSAVVLLSSGAEIDAVVHAFEGQPMELIRSDLSVPEQDRLRQAVEQARQREPGQEALSIRRNLRPGARRQPTGQAGYGARSEGAGFSSSAGYLRREAGGGGHGASARSHGNCCRAYRAAPATRRWSRQSRVREHECSGRPAARRRAPNPGGGRKR
jgi:uncharacterized membrane protein